MPGPVSDSFDPEFGTGANAAAVAQAMGDIRRRVSVAIGADELRYIVDVVHGPSGSIRTLRLSERDLRVLRFSIEGHCRFGYRT